MGRASGHAESAGRETPPVISIEAEAEKREEAGWPLAKTNQLGSRTCSCQVKHPTEDLISRPEQSLTKPRPVNHSQPARLLAAKTP